MGISVKGNFLPLRSSTSMRAARDSGGQQNIGHLKAVCCVRGVFILPSVFLEVTTCLPGKSALEPSCQLTQTWCTLTLRRV